MRENGIPIVRSTILCKESYQALRERSQSRKQRGEEMLGRGELLRLTENEAIMMKGIGENLLILRGLKRIWSNNLNTPSEA